MMCMWDPSFLQVYCNEGTSHPVLTDVYFIVLGNIKKSATCTYIDRTCSSINSWLVLDFFMRFVHNGKKKHKATENVHYCTQTD